MAVALLLAIRSPISVSISWGAIVGLAIIPVTASGWLGYARARRFVLLLAAALACGVFTAYFSLATIPGRSQSDDWAQYHAAILVGLLVTTVVGSWAIRVLGPARFLGIWAAGTIVSVPFSEDTSNPWKYGLALPISLLLVLVVGRTPLLVLAICAPILVVASVAGSYRSWLLVLGVGLAVGLITTRRATAAETLTKPSIPRLIAIGSILTLATLAAGWGISAAATQGLLGEFAQRRTIEQSELADNLLIGGRPEWAAAWASFLEHPLGFGIGIQPSGDDWTTAVRSMPFANPTLQETSTVAGYFNTGLVAFHSTFWTYWGNYGLAGALLVIFIFFWVGRTLLELTSNRLPTNQLYAIAIFLAGLLWDLLFSPTKTDSIAIGVALTFWLAQRQPSNQTFEKALPRGKERMYRVFSQSSK